MLTCIKFRQNSSASLRPFSSPPALTYDCSMLVSSSVGMHCSTARTSSAVWNAVESSLMMQCPILLHGTLWIREGGHMYSLLQQLLHRYSNTHARQEEWASKIAATCTVCCCSSSCTDTPTPRKSMRYGLHELQPVFVWTTRTMQISLGALQFQVIKRVRMPHCTEP